MTTYSHRASGFTDQGVYKPYDLFAGEFPVVRRKETLTGGTFLKRGTVLGRVEKSGSYTISMKDATDGSQKPAAILAEDIDVSEGDKEAVIYHAGEFNSNALIYGKGHDENTVWTSLKTQGPHSIFLRKNLE